MPGSHAGGPAEKSDIIVKGGLTRLILGADVFANA